MPTLKPAMVVGPWGFRVEWPTGVILRLRPSQACRAPQLGADGEQIPASPPPPWVVLSQDDEPRDMPLMATLYRRRVRPFVYEQPVVLLWPECARDAQNDWPHEHDAVIFEALDGIGRLKEKATHMHVSSAEKSLWRLMAQIEPGPDDPMRWPIPRQFPEEQMDLRYEP